MPRRHSEWFGSYLKTIAQFPLLTAEEERQVMRQVRDGNVSARHRAIESCLRLVVYVAKQYNRYSLPPDEVVSAGNRGLCIAVDRFDVKRNVRLSTYATFWIRKEIADAIEQHPLIHVPKYLGYKKRMGYAIHPDILAAAERARRVTDVSELPVPSKETVNQLDEHDWQQQVSQFLASSMNMLTDKQRLILHQRVVVGQTLEQVGELLGLTKERVRQIQVESVKVMHQWHANEARELMEV